MADDDEEKESRRKNEAKRQRIINEMPIVGEARLKTLASSSDIKAFLPAPHFLHKSSISIELVQWKSSPSWATQQKETGEGEEERRKKPETRIGKGHRNEFSCLSRNIQTQLHDALTHAVPRTWKVHKRVPGDCRERKREQNTEKHSSSSSSSSPSVSVVCCFLLLSPLNLPFCEIIHQ